MKLEELRKEIINSYMKRWTNNRTFPQEHGAGWLFNSNGEIDVSGNVWIKDKFSKLPFKFGIIDGDFTLICDDLISLDEFPKRIEGRFKISHNSIFKFEDFNKICIFNTD